MAASAILIRRGLRRIRRLRRICDPAVRLLSPVARMKGGIIGPVPADGQGHAQNDHQAGRGARADLDLPGQALPPRGRRSACFPRLRFGLGSGIVRLLLPDVFGAAALLPAVLRGRLVLPDKFGLPDGRAILCSAGRFGFLRPAGILLRRDPRVALHSLTVQRGIQIRRTLPAIFRPYRQPLQQGGLLAWGEHRAQPGRRDQRVLLAVVPLHGAGRDPAREAVIHRGAQGVHICPRALAMPGILLLRRKPVLQHRRHGVPALDVPGTAEVHQLDLAAFQDHQIIRTDVPVDDSRRVHGLHAPQHRLQHLQQPLGRNPALLGRQFLQRTALQELHHDVGRIVLREIVQHLHDFRDLIQPGHGAGLLKELIPSLLIQILIGLGVAGDVQRHGGLTLDEGGGEIFLDGHPPLQIGVHPQVCDSKAALSQSAAHRIPPVEQAPRREMVAGRLVRIGSFPAAGAGPLRRRGMHTIGTIGFHFIHLSHAGQRRGAAPVFSLWQAYHGGPRPGPADFPYGTPESVRAASFSCCSRLVWPASLGRPPITVHALGKAAGS